MAYLPQDEQNQNAPQGVTSNNPMGGMPPPATGGSSGTGSGVAKANTGPSQGTATQFGSSASKLGDYLTANAPQIQNQANQVVGNLNNQFQQVGTDITGGANQFGQSVAAGYTAPNQDLVNQATSNPTGFAANPENVKGFQAQYNDQYKGPTSYESTTPYANVQNEVNTAVQNAGLMNTQGGLANYFGTQGQHQTQASNTLDALLLQGNPEAQKQVQTAANQFQSLTPQFNQSVTAADAQVPLAQQAAATAAQYAQGQIGNTVTGFNTDIQNELQAATQGAGQNQTNQNALYAAIQNGNLNGLTPDQLQMLGVTAPQATALQTASTDLNTGYGVNTPLGGFYKQGIAGANPVAANVATAPQYAESNALAQLLGQNYTAPLDQANVGQAGTYNPVASNPSFDAKGYGGALQNLLLNKEGITQPGPQQNTNMYLNFLTNTAGTQYPGQNNYRTPQQIAAMKAVEQLSQQGLI